MNQRRLSLFAALAGAAAAFGQAPFGLWPVSLAGFAALAWLVSGRALTARGAGFAPIASTAENPFLAGWAGGFGYFAVSLHWIVEPFLVDVATHGWMAPFALILLAGGLALFWGAAGWLSALLGGSRALSWAVCLAGAEMLRGHIFTGFPWALPAYIWADTWLLASVAWFGPYGLTLLTLVAASLPAMITPMWKGTVPGVLVLGALSTGNLTASLPEGSLGTVRLVQPNAPQHEKWDPDKAHVFVDRALTFTAAPKDGIDLIVWPETAIPYPLDLAGPVLPRIAGAAEGVPVFSGINRRTEDGNWYNSSVLVDAGGAISETYDKVHLVPFGEYIPFKIDLIRAMAASNGYGFTAGDRVRAIETPLGRTVPLICYEAIFPRHSGDLENRQDYLLQITNDAWFGTFSGPYQHLDQARFRAVEQGLSLIRAANTGISAVIDRNGRVVGSLPLGEAGYRDVAVPVAAGPTPYAQTGDWPVIVFVFITIAALFAAGQRNAIANRRTSS